VRWRLEGRSCSKSASFWLAADAGSHALFCAPLCAALEATSRGNRLVNSYLRCVCVGVGVTPRLQGGRVVDGCTDGWSIGCTCVEGAPAHCLLTRVQLSPLSLSCGASLWA